jgi:ribose transport system substrate-binding protein
MVCKRLGTSPIIVTSFGQHLESRLKIKKYPTGELKMSKRQLLFALIAALVLSLGPRAAAAKPKIGFLPGVVDPFYQVMQLGVEAAAKDLGVEVVTQIPATWGVEVQTPILDALVARGDLDYIVTAPTDKDQMIGPLKAAADAGIKIITVDTFLGIGASP